MNAPTTSDRSEQRMARKRLPSIQISGAAQAGLSLIAVGGMLLADNLGWLDAGALLRDWWPALVILAGVSWLVTGAPWVGGAAIMIGVLLLANVQDLIDADIGSLIFPSILVFLGMTLLNASAKVRAAHGTDGRPLRFATAGKGGVGGPNRSDGAGRACGPDHGWPHGDLAATAIFGDARLVVGDSPVELDRITVTALAIFGEVKVDVPAGWRVEDHTTAVLGDVEVPRDQPTYAEAPVVELHGLVLFGNAKARYLDVPGGGR